MYSVLVVAGGDRPNRKTMQIYADKCEYIIAVDKGLDYLLEQDIYPDFVVGDFDSLNQKYLGKIDRDKIIQYPVEKDATDLDIGIDKAVELSPKSLIILGALGGRQDHALTNIFLLKKLSNQGIEAIIEDDKNKIGYINGTKTIIKSKYKYLSIIPLEKTIISISGVKYPLKKRSVDIGQSLTISNEIVADKAHIETNKFALVIESDN